MSDFDAFWSRYPRRVGKLAAMKAYEKALKLASHEQIMAGVELYRQHPPSEAQYIAHPSTWLNQGRWLDEYEDEVLLSKLKTKLRAVDRYIPTDPTWDGVRDCPHEGRHSTRGICQAYSAALERETRTA